jgi:hypothetical protein
MVKHLLNFIFLCIVFCSCSPEQKTEEVKTEIPTPIAAPEPVTKYSFNIFMCDSSNQSLGYGYNIITEGRVFIHQPSIPSIAGNKGFSSKAFAEKTANFVIYKLINNIMPPSITPQELDSLGVLK